jgi:hypothetical protein
MSISYKRRKKNRYQERRRIERDRLADQLGPFFERWGPDAPSPRLGRKAREPLTGKTAVIDA